MACSRLCPLSWCNCSPCGWCRARDARALGWIVQLMPIAFVFRIRANQEYAVLAGILLALLATERSRARPAWAWLTALGFAWALLVKGVFGFLVPIACGVWLVAAEWSDRAGARRRSSGRTGRPRRPRRALDRSRGRAARCPHPDRRVRAGVRPATGDSFLAFYTGPRLNPDAVAGGAIDRAGYNTIWYTARLAWYAFPWSLVACGVSGARPAVRGAALPPSRDATADR